MRAPRPTYQHLVLVARRLGELNEAARQGRDALVERRRAGLPAEPQARDDVVDLLNAQFARGVIEDDEREHRVGLALAARSRGELARAVDGLDLRAALATPVAPPPSRISLVAEEVRRTLRALAIAGAVLIGVLVAITLLVVVLDAR